MTAYRSRRAIRRRQRQRGGFTLVELLIALTAGLIAVTSIYFVSAASSKHFSEQQKVAQTQTQLRMAMEQIRRDVSRAGFLGMPDSLNESFCGTPPVRLRGIEMFDDDSTGELAHNSLNNVSVDRLLLTGNYATSDGYSVDGDIRGQSSIRLQNGIAGAADQAFRRSFFNQATAAYDTALFDAVFTNNRLLHIRLHNGSHFLSRITGTNAGASSVTVSPAPSGECLGSTSGAILAPISQIEYVLVDSGDAAVAALGTGSLVPGADPEVLLRRELDFAGNVVAGSERIVAEYVVEFDVDIVTDTGGAGAAPIWATLNDGAAENALSVDASDARLARIRLSVRTPTEDSRFPFVARGVNAPLTSYDLTADTDGAARVRTLTTDVQLSNFQTIL
ncbi:MAG: prepilin-type N-terminal cleavage/methylation domain-containing protein [Myxococcota bacterium]